MQIFDRPDNAKDATYEQAWAKEVRSAWEQANESGEAVTTGLAIGTKPIVHGREIYDSRDIYTRCVRVRNNLYSEVANIDTTLAAQGGQEIITSADSGDAHWQFTATENKDPDNSSDVYNVCFKGVDDGRIRKDDGYSSSRPVALQIAPSP